MLGDPNSDEQTDDTIWILYRNREEWKDVTPIPQDDGPYPIVAISYSEKCKSKNF